MNTSAKDHNKKLAQKTKRALKELGHDVSLGHCYEVISKQSDFPNWDTAAASGKHLLAQTTALSPEQLLEALKIPLNTFNREVYYEPFIEDKIFSKIVVGLMEHFLEHTRKEDKEFNLLEAVEWIATTRDLEDFIMDSMPEETLDELEEEMGDDLEDGLLDNFLLGDLKGSIVAAVYKVVTSPVYEIL